MTVRILLGLAAALALSASSANAAQIISFAGHTSALDAKSSGSKSSGSKAKSSRSNSSKTSAPGVKKTTHHRAYIKKDGTYVAPK